ncbi:hypothetical protein NE685_00420 [Cutibacterium acnes]|nr:hypothetical protein [Cutibacterium acnes]
MQRNPQHHCPDVMSRLHDAYWDHAHGVGNRCHVDGESLGVDAIDHHPYGGAGTVSVTPPARTSKIAPRW